MKRAPKSGSPRGPRKPPAVRLPEGTRIKVVWPRDGQWYGGMVKKFDAKKALHTIMYDFGDTRRVDLRVTDWELEGDAPAHLDAPVAGVRSLVALNGWNDAAGANAWWGGGDSGEEEDSCWHPPAMIDCTVEGKESLPGAMPSYVGSKRKKQSAWAAEGSDLDSENEGLVCTENDVDSEATGDECSEGEGEEWAPLKRQKVADPEGNYCEDEWGPEVLHSLRFTSVLGDAARATASSIMMSSPSTAIATSPQTMHAAVTASKERSQRRAAPRSDGLLLHMKRPVGRPPKVKRGMAAKKEAFERLVMVVGHDVAVKVEKEFRWPSVNERHLLVALSRRLKAEKEAAAMEPCELAGGNMRVTHASEMKLSAPTEQYWFLNASEGHEKTKAHAECARDEEDAASSGVSEEDGRALDLAGEVCDGKATSGASSHDRQISRSAEFERVRWVDCAPAVMCT